jgi:thioredoxin-like negative regulator of GroEL
VTQGLEKLQQAAQLAPNQAAIRLHLAKALIKAGDKAAARKELDALAEAGQAADKTAADDKDTSAAQKSVPAPAGKAPPLTCGPDCAAEVAALLKTL